MSFSSFPSPKSDYVNFPLVTGDDSLMVHTTVWCPHTCKEWYVNDLNCSTELNVTISVDYTAAPGEDPGGLGPNEFTAGSLLSLNCIVEGTSGSLDYRWSVMRTPTPPTQCNRCTIAHTYAYCL